MQSDAVIIYADEFIIINICIDVICLYMTALICRTAPKPFRLFIAAVSGAAYSLASLFIDSIWLAALFSVLCEMLMCLIAFKITSAKDYFIKCMFFAVSCATVGGIISAIYRLLGISDTAVSTPVLLISVLPFAPVATAYLLAARRRSKIDIVRVVISKGTATVDTQMLVDSGNIATEPTSGLPLIFLAHTLLPRELKAAVMPFGTVCITTVATTETLRCFIPDAITVYRGKKARKVSAAVVCGKQNDYCGTGGLLPASLI